MTAKQKKITAVSMAAVIIAAGAGMGAYQSARHRENEQFFGNVTQPIAENYRFEYDNGSAYGYAPVAKTNLLTGQIELFPYEGGDSVTVCFRGDYPPNGKPEMLHRYEGEGIYDYYAELDCTIYRDGRHSYRLYLDATSGFDPIRIDIAEDGSFSYPENEGADMDEVKLRTVEKNRTDILQLKQDFDNYILEV